MHRKTNLVLLNIYMETPRNNKTNQRIFFDLACQHAPWNQVAKESGYRLNDKTYWAYISENEFNEFKEEMKADYPNAYNSYKSLELNPGKYPPNMAAFGSSSRMIYLIARNIKGFTFEQVLPAGDKYGSAHLDGYLSSSNYEIYVEAKCHEMFSTINNKDIADCYRELYKKINEKRKERFAFDGVHFMYEGKELKRFDLKQVICHFLGIIHKHKNEPKLKEKNIRFIYLTHKLSPAEEDYINNLNPQLLKGIKSVLQEENEEMERIDFSWLFNTLAELQGTTSNSLCNRFEFIHCDTEDCFREKLNI